MRSNFVFYVVVVVFMVLTCATPGTNSCRVFEIKLSSENRPAELGLLKYLTLWLMVSNKIQTYNRAACRKLIIPTYT